MVGECYSFAEMQSVYSTTPTDWAESKVVVPIRDPSEIRFNRGSPCGVVVKELDKFELLPRCCVHFRSNTLGKGMNSLISPNDGFSTMGRETGVQSQVESYQRL